MPIKENTVAAINYTLTDDSGEVLDSSEGREPLTYLHGAGNLIPGLEEALEGSDEGDNLKVTVEPGQAYGEHSEELIQTVPMEAFAGVEQVEPGMRFQATDDQGNVRVVTVTDIAEEEVTVDANHPLAGQQLHFDVNVVGVRPASEEEIERGEAQEESSEQ